MSRRKGALIAGGVLLLVVAAAGAFVLYRESEGGNVRGSSTVEFTPTTPKPPVRPPRHHARPPRVNPIVWPAFGYDQARLHAPLGSRLRPPYRTDWVAQGHGLLEFPPAIAYGRLFLANGRGDLFALDASTGRRLWTYRSGRTAAASPAVSTLDGGTVYETFLYPGTVKDPANGTIVALSAKTGAVRWQKHIGASETPPLAAGKLVFAGDWLGNVWAFDAATGRVRWRYATGGQIKGGVALAGNRAYIGSYDGHLYALDARNGHLLWRASGQPRLFGHGTFYSTPAAAYGRVYIGSTDGKVYSFGATSGKLRWSHSTGNYVYGSPAVWRERVFIGSYDGSFYALDAATGNELWHFTANGPISGSATVLDGIVYFATFKGTTYALNAATGRQIWSFPDGRYSPVVADRKRLYLIGYQRIYALAPR